MHLQSSNVPAWDAHLLRLPDGAVLKEIDRGDIARHAKEVWRANGRDPSKLLTIHRHMGIDTVPKPEDYPFDLLTSWEDAVAYARRKIAQTIDGTFLREYVGYVDYLNEANEFFSDSTWHDPDHGANAIQSTRAYSYVWNEFYRDRTVVADGVEAHIPASMKLALWAGTVSNRIPKVIMQLANTDDQALDYHAYDKYVLKQRTPDSRAHHAFLWDTQEQETGVKVREWVFGEAGAYADTHAGWRSPLCLDGDEALYAAMWEQWIRDCQQTDAYQTGRCRAPVWFTIGASDWPGFEHNARQIGLITDVFARLWKPGEGGDDVDKAKVERLAREIVAEASEHWWEKWPAGALDPNVHKAKSIDASLPLYRAPGPTPFETRTVNPETYILNCHERQGEWLRVTNSATNVIWCKGSDCRPA